jgi:hypothetical protein
MYIPKEIMKPKDFMHGHIIGQNLCYWMLVQLDEKELELTEQAMEEYAKYYHEEKLKEIKK